MIATPGPSDALLDAVATVVRERTGLVFPDGRRVSLATEIAAAMRRTRIGDAEAFLARLRTTEPVFDDLVAHLTVHESYFFRDPAQLQLLRDTIVPALLRSRGDCGTLKIWSAGCSAGEEAYSLAILAHEMGLAGRAHVVGTDLSRPALADARRGVYGRWALRDLPQHIERGYFKRVGSKESVSARIRPMVAFAWENLARHDHAEGGVASRRVADIILCRNVLIYFDGVTVERVARHLLASLSPDGWLLLGASDPPLGDIAPCEVVVTEAGLAYRTHRPTRGITNLHGVSRDAPTMPPAPDRPAVPAVPGTPAGSGVPTSRVALRVAFTEVPAHRQSPTDRRRPVEAADAGGAGNADATLLRVRVLADRGDVQAALRLCDVAVKCFPAVPDVPLLRGHLLFAVGRDAEAAAAARRALYLDRSLVAAHTLLAGALARLGDPHRARRSLEDARRWQDGPS